VLSSQIEGTQASLSDLFLFESGVVAEVTGRGRNRVFVARGILGALER
jgi:hypothetical protein